MADRVSAAHERHDSELVTGCSECDALVPDLAAISASMASLRGGTEAGHRDFRITATDAQRLRRGRGFRAWLRPVAGPRFAFARPLGSALTVIALVGVLASSLPGGLASGGALQVTTAESGREGDHTSEAPRTNTSPSAAAAYGGFSGSPKASASDAAAATTTQPTRSAKAVAPMPNPPASPTAQRGIFLASIVILPIGLLLVGGRGLARRLMGAAREP